MTEENKKNLRLLLDSPDKRKKSDNTKRDQVLSELRIAVLKKMETAQMKSMKELMDADIVFNLKKSFFC